MTRRSHVQRAAALTLTVWLGGVATIRSQDAAPQPDAADPAVAGAAVGEQADDVLRSMGDYLEAVQEFSFRAVVVYDSASADGQKIQYDFATSVVIQRPNNVRADRTAYRHKQLLVYNGKTLTIHDHQNDTYYYASAPVPDNIDDLLIVQDKDDDRL